jgi:CheY-like chemotaxis protein
LILCTQVTEGQRAHADEVPANRHVSVLVVDDDLDIRLTLEELLKDEGFSVATASNGKDALERLQTTTPTLILLDLTMPVMSGAQFRGIQLQNPNLAAIPTVVMTADGQALEKSTQLKAQECLTKPIDLDHLFQLLNRYCK